MHPMDGWTIGLDMSVNLDCMHHNFNQYYGAPSCFVLNGIEEEIQYPQVQISPNPTSGQIEILGKGDRDVIHESSIVIYDLTGSVIANFDHDFSTNEILRIDLSAYPSNIYIILLETEGFQVRRKIVKI